MCKNQELYILAFWGDNEWENLQIVPLNFLIIDLNDRQTLLEQSVILIGVLLL